jgi:hypothetical protein
MNTNTYNATPALDEIISTSEVRVFDDGGDLYPLWWELRPGKFWCGRNVKDAEDTRETVNGYGVSLRQLLDSYPNGTLK